MTTNYHFFCVSMLRQCAASSYHLCASGYIESCQQGNVMTIKFLSTLHVQPMRAISDECLPSCTWLIRNLSIACQMMRSVRATVHLLSWLQVSPCGTLVTAPAQSRHCC